MSALCFDSAEQFLNSGARHKVACLIADIHMPGMSGIELQAKLKAERCRIPIIFITGHGDIPLAVSVMKEGASDFFTKPVLLKETDGDRYLPIWIGAVEATAIAFAQQGVLPARPLTHDLFRDVLDAFDVQLRTVNITALREGIFFADLVFSNGVEVSARPSDSIALALRTGASIFASEDVLEEAGVAIPDEQEDEVEKFREFLDTISPEDFGRAT